jgi:hypothetical protein
MKKFALMTLTAIALLGSAPRALAVTLDEACTKFAAKMGEAQASGDPDKVKQVYTKGSQRVAAKFNGATCPNVKAP